MKIEDVKIINHRVLLFVLMVGMFSLTACTQYPTRKRDPQVVANPDKVSLMLAEAADKASNALQTLAAVEQSRAPAVAVEPIHNAPSELTRAMTITWYGPAEQLVKKLADRASYTYLSVGDKPPVPLTVNLDVENEPVIDILRDVGLQLGVRADIKVDSTRQMIELHYAPVTGLGR
ncbi:MAG: DotD/TraH family lipoprotein [Alphaproteobacteria bacterium]|nr:DotD/TraH family lipoprotein [Alphaproteobacteria bacterium]